MHDDDHYTLNRIPTLLTPNALHEKIEVVPGQPEPQPLLRIR